MTAKKLPNITKRLHGSPSKEDGISKDVKEEKEEDSKIKERNYNNRKIQKP